MVSFRGTDDVLDKLPNWAGVAVPYMLTQLDNAIAYVETILEEIIAASSAGGQPPISAADALAKNQLYGTFLRGRVSDSGRGIVRPRWEGLRPGARRFRPLHTRLYCRRRFGRAGWHSGSRANPGIRAPASTARRAGDAGELIQWEADYAAYEDYVDARKAALLTNAAENVEAYRVKGEAISALVPSLDDGDYVIPIVKDYDLGEAGAVTLHGGTLAYLAIARSDPEHPVPADFDQVAKATPRLVDKPSRTRQFQALRFAQGNADATILMRVLASDDAAYAGMANAALKWGAASTGGLFASFTDLAKEGVLRLGLQVLRIALLRIPNWKGSRTIRAVTATSARQFLVTTRMRFP